MEVEKTVYAYRNAHFGARLGRTALFEGLVSPVDPELLHRAFIDETVAIPGRLVPWFMQLKVARRQVHPCESIRRKGQHTKIVLAIQEAQNEVDQKVFAEIVQHHFLVIMYILQS